MLIYFIGQEHEQRACLIQLSMIFVTITYSRQQIVTLLSEIQKCGESNFATKTKKNKFNSHKITRGKGAISKETHG